MVTPDDLKILPDKPGVYLMKDSSGQVIYIGKAVSLRHRVRSYFQASRNHSLRIESMIRQVDRVEYITVASEVEALVLECNLIKEEHPKYNIRLRDDKQYPWIKVTLRETFPQIYITRTITKDGNKYYGPYTDTGALRETFRLLRRIFPLRGCKQDLDREKRDRPCLNYHIKRCLAPCSGNIDREAYREMIRQVCLFLEGRQGELLEKLRNEMAGAAGRREYERAARLRDQIRDIEKILEKQKVVSGVYDDSDVFGLAGDGQGTVVQIFQVRQGKLVGREFFHLTAGIHGEALEDFSGDEPDEILKNSIDPETHPLESGDATACPQSQAFREGDVWDDTGREATCLSEVLEAFLPQYYDGSGYIPRSLLLPFPLENQATLADWLSREKGGPVQIRVPQKGEKLQLVRMAMENAQILLNQERTAEKQRFDANAAILNELREQLHMPSLPFRIEGFDISNIQGTEAVASMVVFENGLPKGSDYRRFKIRTIQGPNDFAMLQEAVRRRFLRGLEERAKAGGVAGESPFRQSFARFPDLLLIDGGKGQLSGVREVLAELNLSHITTIGLAKQEEEIFQPEQEEPLLLSRHSPALKLLQRVRDEAHRFAITYHKSLRDKHIAQSSLDKITGIGPKKKQLLLKHFGSVKRIQAATLEELMKVPGINHKTALKIKEQMESC
ncbi:MAG: excinuclease ABC subunit UvrC [Firmicutes bacterium]|nr:excinuclease ABC subunit UvrC [Bacillota bacterium]